MIGIHSSLLLCQIGSWNILNIKYSLDSQWTIHTEAQIRSLGFYSQFHYHEYKVSINYSLHPELELSLGIGDYDTYQEGGNFVVPKNNDELRIWPQARFRHKTASLEWEHRYRAELRFTTQGYKNRFRYRIGIKYALPKGLKKWSLGLSNEVFFTNREPYFERNRWISQCSYKANKQLEIQMAYLHQLDYKINDETGRDFIQIALNISLSSAQ